MYKVIKEFEISCSHRLNNTILNESENSEIFGKCNNSPSHGHNYIISVEVSSEFLINGMVINFNDIKTIFKRVIDDVYDHKFLNDCPGFEVVIVTAENMAELFYRLLKTEILNLSKIIVQETEGARASYEE
jgi:6-pyruvoyltetrahydropterin/6-carboxytetrahydropterin synthase